MRYLFFTLLILLSVLSCKNNPQNANSPIVQTASMDTKQLRHVVLFKFKDSTTAADLQEIEAAFAALPDQISEIVDFEWGLNNSPEGLDKGFTHCFFVTFATEADRAIYLPHPAHKAFVAIVEPHVADVLVIDYWN